MVRKPADPEEELRWMAQEVRGYVEAVLNSLAANVPKVSLNIYLLNHSCFHVYCTFCVLLFLILVIRRLFCAKWKNLKKICLISYTVLLGKLLLSVSSWLEVFVHAGLCRASLVEPCWVVLCRSWFSLVEPFFFSNYFNS